MKVSSENIWPLNDPDDPSAHYAILEDLFREAGPDEAFWYHQHAGVAAIAERAFYIITGEYPLPEPIMLHGRRISDGPPPFISRYALHRIHPALESATLLERLVYGSAARVLSDLQLDHDQHLMMTNVVLWRLERRGVLDAAAMAEALSDARRVGRERGLAERRWWHRLARPRLRVLVAENPHATQAELARTLKTEMSDWQIRRGGHQRIPGVDAIRKAVGAWLREDAARNAGATDGT